MSRTIQPYTLLHGAEAGLLLIDVPEGSDLLDITLGYGESFVPPAPKSYTAWCIVDISLPWTRRFFRLLMPGSHIPQRSDALRFVTTMDDGGMIWLVFEDIARRREYLKEKYA